MFLRKYKNIYIKLGDSSVTFTKTNKVEYELDKSEFFIYLFELMNCIEIC